MRKLTPTAVLVSAAASLLFLTACTDGSLEEAAQEETTESVETLPAEPENEPLDKTDQVTNSPELVERLYNLSKASCELANEQGMTASTDLLKATTILVPESQRIQGIAGFARSEIENNEPFIINDSSDFPSCALYSAAVTSEEAYGEPLAHVQLTENEDQSVTFDFLFSSWTETVKYELNDDGTIASSMAINPDGEVLVTTTFETGISDEDYTEYLSLIEGENG